MTFAHVYNRSLRSSIETRLGGCRIESLLSVVAPRHCVLCKFNSGYCDGFYMTAYTPSFRS